MSEPYEPVQDAPPNVWRPATPGPGPKQTWRPQVRSSVPVKSPRAAAGTPRHPRRGAMTDLLWLVVVVIALSVLLVAFAVWHRPAGHGASGSSGPPSVIEIGGS